MSIKRKIVLLTTLWLIGILLAVNLTVYYAFLRITTDNERDLLLHRAHTLLERVQPTDIIQGKNTDLLQIYLPDQGMIRLMDPKGKILQTIENDKEIVQIEADPVTSDHSELYRQSVGDILVVRTPIISGGQVLGTMEIAEKLDVLEENINILISILTLCSLGAIGMSLIGGLYLSKWILRPISGMVRIMEEIEQSLVYRKIPLNDGSKDELHAMASTFNRMMSRLEDNFIRQQQFVSDASHELKTPLTVIEGYANMLRRWGLKDEENGRVAVEAIYSEALRMKQMTEHLLDLASTENMPELVMETIELVSFSEHTVDMLRKLYHREIKVIPTHDTLLLNANAGTMNQLLHILLDNALKYSKESIELFLSEIEHSDTHQEGIEIRVKDLGIGIPKDELHRVFERFYRVDPSRHRKTGGNGLGLSIARNIVHLHGGTIDIESQEHAGTEVIVFIPFQ
jgi:two-component system, OmpR family, sensor histidine kinase ArlS